MRTADSRADTNGNGVAVMPRAESHFVFPDPSGVSGAQSRREYDDLTDT